MTLKTYLHQRVFAEKPVVGLPAVHTVYQSICYWGIVYAMRAIVNAMPDDFQPDDDLPVVNEYPTDNELIARYNLRMLILTWRVWHEEVNP